MARPTKSTVDYFPHSCQHGKTMFIIESRYGNDGYAFWFKLLELLGDSPGHSYDVNNAAAQEFLSAIMHMPWESCKQILKLLASLDAIDSELWVHGLIWSDNFVEGIRDAYSRRQNKLPQKPSVAGISADNNLQASEFATDETGKGKEKEREREKEKTSSQATRFQPDSIEIGLAEFFIGLLDARAYEWPKNKKSDIQAWASDFDKLMRIDGRPPERIREVLTWMQNNFWGTVCLSPKNLRENWGKITEKMKNEKKSQRRGKDYGPGSGEYDPLIGAKEYLEH